MSRVAQTSVRAQTEFCKPFDLIIVRGLAPVRLPDHSDKAETWHLSFGDKKKLYGSARISVSESGGEDII